MALNGVIVIERQLRSRDVLRTFSCNEPRRDCRDGCPQSGCLRREEGVMSTLLARNSCGRILLHVAAMLLDRQVRWHCAGIAREVRLRP